MSRDTIHEYNNSFSKEQPGLQLFWDSTSLGLLKTCPRKYYLKMIEGWSSRKEAVPLVFGIHYHDALEEYDRMRMNGKDHEEALLDIVHMMMKKTGIRTPEGKFIPWESGDSNRNRETLVRSVVWYLDQFEQDPLEVVKLKNGKPAVEVSFKMELPIIHPKGDPYILCGHLDKVVDFGNETWILDHKTTKMGLSNYYFQQYDPNNQMSLYTFAANVVLEKKAKGVIVNAAQVGVNFTRFARRFSLRTAGQLDEWYKDLEVYLRQAEQYAQNNYWPMNDTACDKFGGCEFLGICSSDPAMRERFLESDFSKKIWDPTQQR